MSPGYHGKVAPTNTSPQPSSAPAWHSHYLQSGSYHHAQVSPWSQSQFLDLPHDSLCCSLRLTALPGMTHRASPLPPSRPTELTAPLGILPPISNQVGLGSSVLSPGKALRCIFLFMTLFLLKTQLSYGHAWAQCLPSSPYNTIRY